MASRSDDRSFPNPFENRENFEKFSVNEYEFNEDIAKLKQRLLEIVLKKGASSSDHEDISVYTGISGVALLLVKLGHQNQAKEILESAIRRGERKPRVTFLCGIAGPLALLCAITKSESHLQQLLGLLPLLSSKDMPDELLYGRAGYLYALLHVKKSLPEEHEALEAAIKTVCDMIVKSGQTGSKRFKTRSPLMYEWHEKQYYGAAHGLVGILFMLLQAGDKYLSSDVLENLVRPSVDYLKSSMFPSGNLPSSRGSEQDKLIHWCHGAPGVVHLFLMAHQVYKSQAYLEAAKRCGDVIWRRGMLKKGYGLCHGTCGNAYAFVALYQSTNDDTYLKKARVFTQFVLEFGKHGCRTPDRPYSLFEGMCGTIHFLDDMQRNPEEAKFPCFYV